jgi:hypothetical protein
MHDLDTLSTEFGANATAKGFREEGDRLREQLEWAVHRGDDTEELYAVQNYSNYLVKRISLIGGEVKEAEDEIRAGHAPDETYYPSKGSDLSLVALRDNIYKPEGVPSELADILIRTLELCDELNIVPSAIVAEKHAYNKTRARMHGKKF